MCSDHEVAEFTWNHDRQAVTGKTHVLDAAHAPLMATDPSGNITRDRLSSWFKNRGIPDFRPDAADRLRAVGYPSAASLMASGFGASLSDQYWIRPAGSASTWRDVNCFENDFSEELGELLLPHDASSVPSLIEKIRGNADLLASSPDAALNGNLPKRWTIEGGQRMLVKSGRSSGRFQEPFNEKIASVLCSRLLDEGDYVAYELEDGGFMKWTSRCKPMTDQVTEFVPAWALLCSSKRPSDLGLHDFYVSACAARGLDVREDVEKMLVIDYLMANFDRHWNNFGVLIDSESREWLRAAPVFDTGEALWCDRELSQPFGVSEPDPDGGPSAGTRQRVGLGPRGGDESLELGRSGRRGPHLERAAVAARLVLDDDRRAECLLEGRALSPKPRRILVLLGRFVLLPAPEEVGPRAGPLGDRLRPGLDPERGVRAP